MNALVIGGTGTTGPFIMEGLLGRGYKVTMLHRGTHEVEMPFEVEHLHADPHWPESLNEAMKGKSFDLVVATYGRLRHVAEAVKGHTPRLVSSGGYAVYKGWLRISDPHVFQNMEETPMPVPEEGFLEEPGVDHFVDRIREAELAVMQAHLEGHYNATHFRYPIVYGPRHLAPADWSIIRRALDGRRQLVLPNGGQVLLSRGYGENVAHAILLAIDKPDASAGQIYNIRDDRLLTNRQWVKLIAQVIGHEFEFVDMPLGIVRPGYSYAYPAGLMFPYHQVMDITKAKEELGYRDLVPVERAMELTVKWFLENKPAPRGELEQNIGDPFDYAAEDRLIHRLSSIWEDLRQTSGTEYSWRHPYAHPQKRGDLK